jgi:hypothetical protein
MEICYSLCLMLKRKRSSTTVAVMCLSVRAAGFQEETEDYVKREREKETEVPGCVSQHEHPDLFLAAGTRHRHATDTAGREREVRAQGRENVLCEADQQGRATSAVSAVIKGPRLLMFSFR